MRIKAKCVGREIDTKRLAKELGITKRIKWEEPIEIEKNVYVYSFGVIVTIDRDFDSIQLKDYIYEPFYYEEEIEVKEGKEIKIEDDTLYVPKITEDIIKAVSFVLAQYVAIKRIEYKVEKLGDDLEKIIEDMGNPFKRRKIIKELKILLLERHYLINDLYVFDEPEFLEELSDDAQIVYRKLWRYLEIDSIKRIVNLKLENYLETARTILEYIEASSEILLELMIVLLFILDIILYFAS